MRGQREARRRHRTDAKRNLRFGCLIALDRRRRACHSFFFLRSIKKKKTDREKTKRRQRHFGMDSLPSEILWFLLNGALSTPRIATRGWVPPGRRDRVRPFLDPRWRFAARAVCRLWQEVIETPTPSEIARLHRHRSKRHGADGEDGHSWHCPKWTTGRLVCASVVAQWIATDTGPWSHGDADTVWAWCTAHARASRKHVMAALVASDASWAVDAAMTTGWICASFADDHGDDANVNGDDRALHSALDCVDQRGDWWDDQRGDVQGLRDALWDIAARHASYRTLLALAAREPASHRAHALGRALDRACRAGRADTVRALLDNGVRPESAAWTHAARAPNPDCFVVLLDHAPDGPHP